MEYIQTELTKEEITQLYNYYWNEVDRIKGRRYKKKHKRIIDFLSNLKAENGSLCVIDKFEKR